MQEIHFCLMKRRETVLKTVIENYVIGAHDDEKLHTCHRAAVLAVHNGSFHEFHYHFTFGSMSKKTRQSKEVLTLP